MDDYIFIWEEDCRLNRDQQRIAELIAYYYVSLIAQGPTLVRYQSGKAAYAQALLSQTVWRLQPFYGNPNAITAPAQPNGYDQYFPLVYRSEIDRLTRLGTPDDVEAMFVLLGHDAVFELADDAS